MRLLVPGAEGMLGQDFVRLARAGGHEVTARGRKELDVTDAATVRAAVAATAPEAIVNCAAFTDVDGAETREDEAMAVNGDGPGHLARAAQSVGARLLHVSTDYVFAGDDPTPRREDDRPAPRSAYGRSKLVGELAIAATGGDYTIVRSAWVYGAGGKNFVDTINDKLREGARELRVVDDQVGSPTWTVSLAGALLALLEVPASGVVHFGNRGAVSWHGLATAIAEAGDYRVEIARLSTGELGRPAVRPAHSVLATGRYEKLTGQVPTSWRDALAAYLRGATT